MLPHPQLEGDHGLCCQLIAELLKRCRRNREAKEKYELALQSWRTARTVREDSETIVGFRNTAVALAHLLREQGEREASKDRFVEASALERESRALISITRYSRLSGLRAY